MNSPLPVAWELLPENARTLVAVSGGADSTALLLALRDGERDIIAGHVNHDLHELRNGDCERDELWLRDFCARVNVPLACARVELPRKSGHVNEVVARTARYRELERLAREHSCALVATGHTAQDVLETLLLFQMRGVSVRGQGGIAPIRPLNHDVSGGVAEQIANEVALVRPLLHATREQTREFCRAHDVTWREDASNQSPQFRRNRVRHELLPLLADIAATPPDTLARNASRSAQIRRDEDAYLDEQARAGLWAITLRRETLANGGELRVLNGVAFQALPIALQRRALWLCGRELGGAPTSAGVESVRCHAIAGGKRKVWQWPGEGEVRHVSCEWTGPGSGNRLRVRGVPKTIAPH